MKYRIITRWGITEEVNEQYFWTYGDADTVCDYLARATENGAKVAWVLQERQEDGQVMLLDACGWIGGGESLSWTESTD